MKYYVIYALKHADTPIYVGCTTNLKKRLSYHLHPSTTCRLVREYMDEHGRNKMDYSMYPLSQHSDKTVAETIEAHYVQKFTPCCNLTSDGIGRSDNRGEKNPMYGKKHSAETRAKISKAGIGRSALRGERHPSYGKPAPNRHPVWEHADEIVRLYNEEGLSQLAIAEKFDCGRNPIQSILKHFRQSDSL